MWQGGLNVAIKDTFLDILVCSIVFLRVLQYFGKSVVQV